MTLQEFYQSYYNEITWTGGAIVAVLFFLIKTYLSEKTKLKAQISENKKLIDQTESIKSHYSKQLEEIKKEHQLDVSKRKYQYESKKDSYLTFFKLLDEFSGKNNVETQDAFLPMLDEFNRNYLHAVSKGDKKAETNATIVFQKKVQKLMFDSNQALIKIKQETNTIRIIASKDMLLLLDLLTRQYDLSFQQTSTMMQNLSKLTLARNEAKLQENQDAIKRSGERIDLIHKEIIALMRIELNEI